MKASVGLTALGLAVAIGGLASAQPALSLLESDGLPSLAPVLAKVAPTVVSVMVETSRSSTSKNGHPAKPAANSAVLSGGSGVILDSAQGLIVTNNHVIEHADAITATFYRGRRQVATLVGADPETDLALLKAPLPDLTAIAFGDSARLRSGDFVMSIGIPYPLGRTTTLGLVSAVHRSNIGLAAAEDFIQTDTAIYPGDSGGALVNLRGDLVGVNAGYIGGTSINSGVGFAIPSDLVRRVTEQLLQHGSVRRGSLGFVFGDPKPSAVRASTVTRPVVEKVDPGSSAERAGIKVGDLVTAIDGVGVRNADELQSKLALDWLGESVELALMRDGQPMVVRAVLEDGGSAKAKSGAR